MHLLRCLKLLPTFFELCDVCSFVEDGLQLILAEVYKADVVEDGWGGHAFHHQRFPSSKRCRPVSEQIDASSCERLREPSTRGCFGVPIWPTIINIVKRSARKHAFVRFRSVYIINSS